MPIPCPPGTYQGSTAQTSCSVCSNGYYTNIKGASACYQLPTGHHSINSKSASAPCPVGTYPDTSDYDTCITCTAGYLCGIIDSSAAPASATCPLGYFCPADAGLSAVVMHPCPPGKYGTSEGASTEAAGCTSCAAGKYCPGGTHLPITCPVNAYCPAGAAAPTICGSGTYNKKQGESASSACVACSSALYCAQDGTGLPCSSVNCPSNSPTSVSCPAGQYMPIHKIDDTATATTGDCEACPKGHYCVAGTIEPVPCPIGTYRSTTGGTALTGCSNCPAGKACPFIGIVDAALAVACDYGHY